MTDLPHTDNLLLEFDKGWLTIWFNRPDNRNALSAELTADLWAVLRAVREDRSVRGISMRGKGGVFCAGGDLKAFRSGFQGGAQALEDVAESSREGGHLFDYVNTMPQVVVMLVEGPAMAGGMGLMCTGDVTVATRDSKFALTETTLGIPPAQIAPFVAQRIGLPAARRLMLTGARFDGAQAHRLGLADELVEDAGGLEAMEAVIKKGVMRCAPGANAWTKHIVLQTPYLGRAAMTDLAGQGFAECMLSEEGREGVAAFLEKRKPAWAQDS